MSEKAMPETLPLCFIVSSGVVTTSTVRFFCSPGNLTAMLMLRLLGTVPGGGERGLLLPALPHYGPVIAIPMALDPGSYSYSGPSRMRSSAG